MAGYITAIEVQKKNKARANISIDGEFAFGLALIEAAKLSKGQYLTDQDIAALQAVDEQERAYEQALNLLSYRPRSEAEITRRLEQKGYSEIAIEKALERLSRAKLVDDEAFARYWISNREQFNPRGEYALRQELRQKGIAEDIANSLLEEVDGTEGAYRLAVQRLSRWEHTGDEKQLDSVALYRKLSGYLQRRGFSYEVIQEVWERLKAERAADGIDLEESEDATWDLKA